MKKGPSSGAGRPSCSAFSMSTENFVSEVVFGPEELTAFTAGDRTSATPGDPALGDTSRIPIITAYCQQALTRAAALLDGPRRPRDLQTALPDAPRVLLSNVYGWFNRIEKGLMGSRTGPCGSHTMAPGSRGARQPRDRKPIKNQVDASFIRSGEILQKYSPPQSTSYAISP